MTILSPENLEKHLWSPPYRLLPLAVFVILEVVFIGLVLDHLPLNLADPDDYMRLNQAISWLDGQGWYDLSQPRMSPGAHIVLHWARCVDVPIVLLMMPLTHWVGTQHAALAAAMIAPALPLVLLLIILPALARPLMGRRWRNLMLLSFLVAAPLVLPEFKPGAVDHHNWEIAIAATGFWGLQTMLLHRQGGRAAIIAAIAFAFGLWIGAEIVPVLALTVGCLAGFGAWRGSFALRNMAFFGVSLFVATAALLPAALPVTAWGDRSISWFSTGYIILTGLVGAALVAGGLLGAYTSNKGLRLALVAALCFHALMLFVLLVPDVLGGPFANYDLYNRSEALQVIQEAMPFIGKITVHTEQVSAWTYAADNFCLLDAVNGIGPVPRPIPLLPLVVAPPLP